ncbi:toll/interleukin-1 receptor domain-containing protein [Flavobacterium xinjiangense]|uniref:TIR domain-containing protein n=1 Tax=Flavobacterium xinjiangense TaxID=178356 RepID=A0A1M7P736_9FLAO|nr:toll/interleukin-1 receptor domain-containing protein [Flavobacterium xinjiangense]SHN12468.1 TIR domain-containing protein [Flavobacterium xinjiangense]
MKGFNKASMLESISWELERMKKISISNRPCVFLSHKKEDKQACREIAKYLSKAEIDYYLDEEDTGLQSAASANDPYLITESIKKGIRESSHMLCVVSEKTFQSNWIPFEVGYGHAAIIDKAMIEKSRDQKIKLSILTLKEISERSLPDFMKVGYQIRGTISLNKYISELTNESESKLINENRLQSKSYSFSTHVLDNYLNWEK